MRNSRTTTRDTIILPIGNVDAVLPFDITSTDSSPPGLLTVTEVAEMLKISVSGVRRLQQQRRIPFIKVGGSIRFATRDVASFVDENRVEIVGRI